MIMKWNIIKLIIIILSIVNLLFITSGCHRDIKSPTDTVVVSFNAAINGNYSEAYKFISQSFIMRFKDHRHLFTQENFVKMFWGWSPYAPIKIEPIRQEINGNLARVYTNIYYSKEKFLTFYIDLGIEDGIWKLRDMSFPL